MGLYKTSFLRASIISHTPGKVSTQGSEVLGSGFNGSPFRVIFVSLTLLISQQVLNLPARALTPICFFNDAPNTPNNLFFPYILRSHMAGG